MLERKAPDYQYALRSQIGSALSYNGELFRKQDEDLLSRAIQSEPVDLTKVNHNRSRLFRGLSILELSQLSQTLNQSRGVFPGDAPVSELLGYLRGKIDTLIEIGDLSLDALSDMRRVPAKWELD